MRAGVLLILCAVCAGDASAQDNLSGWWARVENTRSLEELASLGSVSGLDAEVAEALIRFRKYELGRDRTDALVVRSDLERLASKTESAQAWFALGIALARGPDLRIRTGELQDAYFATSTSNAAKQAPRALKRALALDPALDEAAYVLADLALDLGDRALAQDALTALDRPMRQSPRAWQLRAQLYTHLGEIPRAVTAAKSLHERGGDASMADYLAASALLRTAGSHEEGARLYFAGAARLSEASARLYFAAIAPVLSSSELRAWERADLAGKADWLRRFWDVHASLAGVPVAVRLGEHYRRHAIITRTGRVAPMGADGAGAGEAPDVRSFGVSSLREMMLLRHGDPVRAERVRYCGREVMDIPLALAPTPQQCKETAISRMRERNAAAAGGTRLVIARSIERALPGTTFYPPFRKHLHMVHELLQFRGADGLTALVAAVALPASSAIELVRDDVIVSRIELGIIDTAAARVARHDTIRSFAVPRLLEGTWVLLNTELSLPARPAQQYRIGVMDRERTAGRVSGGALDVRDYNVSTLELSDIVITPLDGVPSFMRGAARLSLAPGREYAPDEEFSLYYEVYGLQVGDAYRTDLLIRPQPDGLADRLRALLPGSRDAIALTFHDVADAVHAVYGVQQARTVGLNDLVPGSYTVQVTITNSAGRTITRERPLIVRR